MLGQALVYIGNHILELEHQVIQANQSVGQLQQNKQALEAMCRDLSEQLMRAEDQVELLTQPPTPPAQDQVIDVEWESMD